MTTIIPILLNINDQEVALQVEPHWTLLHVVREKLGLKGTKPNCLEGECGACTVLIDGLAINSCLYLAVRTDGKKVTTIEGLSDGETLHPVQTAFIEQGAVQCGYCTPGFIMSAVSLLAENSNPTDEEINQALSGNICRCTGYVNIRKAVKLAAGKGGQPL